MLGLATSLHDHFSLAAMDAAFDRDDASLKAYELAERTIAAAGEESLPIVVNELRDVLQTEAVSPENKPAQRVGFENALRVLDDFQRRTTFARV